MEYDIDKVLFISNGHTKVYLSDLTEIDYNQLKQFLSTCECSYGFVPEEVIEYNEE